MDVYAGGAINFIDEVILTSPDLRQNTMEAFAVFAAVIAAFLTAVLFAFLSYTVYLVIVHRRYAHIPTPKGAS